MKYIEVRIETSHEGTEAVAAALLSLGITDVAVDDPADVVGIMDKKEGYEWDYIEDDVITGLDRAPVVSVFMEDTPEARDLARAVEMKIKGLRDDVKKGVYGDGATFGELSAEVIFEDDSQWKDRWKEYFKPSAVCLNWGVRWLSSHATPLRQRPCAASSRMICLISTRPAACWALSAPRQNASEASRKPVMWGCWLRPER